MKRKKKGFTLVELLVVIAIIALLMGILMPALAKVRQLAYRMVCGTNLSGLGKAMLIYANDYEDELPRAGGKESIWVESIPQWDADDRYAAYDMARPKVPGGKGEVTITASLYLPVKYTEVTPKSFVCKGEPGISEFKLSDYENRNPNCAEFIDAWDFGPDPMQHCSYSYHLPYDVHALTTVSDPGMAVAADSNPWQTTPAADNKDPSDPQEGLGAAHFLEEPEWGNSQAHQGDGQNVLFMDTHVNFERRSFCAIDDDNIYTYWHGSTTSKRGMPPEVGTIPDMPNIDRRLDSFLVTDGKSK